jgi:hypothetical protein
MRTHDQICAGILMHFGLASLVADQFLADTWGEISIPRAFAS